jgi:hypothetical protein
MEAQKIISVKETTRQIHNSFMNLLKNTHTRILKPTLHVSYEEFPEKYLLMFPFKEKIIFQGPLV